MKLKYILHWLAAFTLLLLAGVLVYYAFGLRSSAGTDKQLEVMGTVLIAALSAVGGIYVLFFQRGADIEKIQLEGAIAQLTKSIDNAQQLANGILISYSQSYFREQVEPRIREIEANAHSASRFVELEYQDDFRKRERRDQALLKLSSTVIKTTRAFHVLTKFKPAIGESTEPLVNALAQALAAREAFLAAREELTVLHAVGRRHAAVLREYALLLIGIIIDLRRHPPNVAVDGETTSYSSLMDEYGSRLQQLDDYIARVLAVFLAPRHREPVAPDIPGERRKGSPGQGKASDMAFGPSAD
jgi:hypothetical protein